MISWVLLTAGLVCGQAADSAYAAYMDSSGDKTQSASDSKSQAQSGNYQQYMEKYAGGSSQGGDYQQYMKKYAGGSQGGDYQQYMNKYAGGSQGGDYQKYMKKYAGGSQGGGGDYQQYYEKYMDKYAKGSQGGSQSGDYEQYMKKYAGGKSGDYQQYMKKYAGGQGGDYQQYMKKYSGGKGASSATELLEKSPEKKSDDSAVGSELNLQATAGTNSNSNYQKYMSQYAGGSGQGGDYQKYMNEYAGKYAGSYEKYMDYQTFMKRYQNEHGKEIGSASDANTTTQLNEWYSGAKNSVQWYVPDSYSSYATHDIDKTYQKRLSEIQGHKGASSPFVDTAMNLQEKPQTNFLAKTEKATEAETKDAETQHATKAEVVQSQVTAHLQLLADQVKSDPAPCAAMALLGVAFAFIVFFAIRRRRSIQTPEIMLG